MERFLSPGYKVSPKVEATTKARGRPKVNADEGALDLGEKRARVCGSTKRVIEEQRIREMERRLELWKQCNLRQQNQMRRCSWP